MTHPEKPLFVVARGQDWVSTKHSPERSLPAFGTREDAEAFARGVAKAEDVPAHAFVIVQYVYSEKVFNL